MKLKSAFTLANAGVAGGGGGYGHAPEAAGHHSPGGNSFHWLRQFVARQFVETVPEDIAICVFDCRKTQCTQAEWEACERRISKGAGELFPGL